MSVLTNALEDECIEMRLKGYMYQTSVAPERRGKIPITGACLESNLLTTSITRPPGRMNIVLVSPAPCAARTTSASANILI